MSATASRVWDTLPIDLSWRNFVFSFRTILAALVALAISYWLSLQDPQWAMVTVYVIAQPTAGAALAKGFYRFLGTLVGAVVGLATLALFAEDAAPLVAMMVVWLGLCIYGATIARNFVAYGFLLAGFTALLVAYQGAADPTSAWQIAVDRSAEIAIGIACATAASVLIMPRYAGDDLRTALAATFAALAAYGATAMRPETPVATFMALRRRMIGQIVTFDALGSFAAFEARDMRVNHQAIDRVTRAFLAVLAVARGLYFRLDDFRAGQAGVVLAQLDAVLPATAASLQRISGADRAFVEAELETAGARLAAAATDLEALAGTVPLDPLANGLLVIHRAGDLLHGMTMVLAAEAETTQAASAAPPQRGPGLDPTDAVLQALRAALALLLISVFWASTTWSGGFSGIVALVLSLMVSINQGDPGRMGWPYLIAVAIAMITAYFAMAFVLPWLPDFGALSIFLVIVMVPAGLVMGTPRYALVGVGFGALFIAQICTGNLYQPNAQLYVNTAFAMVLGMVACLVVVAALMPVDPVAIRERAWRKAMRAVPAAARGERPQRAVASDIISILADLLPRLDLEQAAEDSTLRGMLGTASMTVELDRLHGLVSDTDLPSGARGAIAACLDKLAETFPGLVNARTQRGTALAGAEAAVAAARAELASVSLTPGSAAARDVLRAAASLRFIDDRFGIDRQFLLGTFVDAAS